MSAVGSPEPPEPPEPAQPLVPAWAELKWVRRALLMVDVVESVRLTRSDPVGFLQRWSRFVHELRTEVMPRHGGRIVKSLGDGLLMEFEQAAPAAAAALEMHASMRALNVGLPDDRLILLRAGADVGDVVIHELDDLGDPANVAARLAAEARAGQTLVSAAFRDELVPGLDADVEDLGPLYLKHLDQPVRGFVLHPSASTGNPWAPSPPLVKLPELTARLAVLPFEILQAQPGMGLLGDAVADELIQVLSHNASLTVISRMSTSAFRGRAHNLAAVSQHLRADLVLTGRVHLHGDQMRLLLELVDVAESTVVWSETARASTTGVFSGEDQVLEDLAARLMEALTLRQVDRSRRQPMATLQSYCLLMAAIRLMHGSSRADFQRAHNMLEHLVARDRRHPAPHAWLAKWHVLRVQQGWSEDRAGDTRLALDCTRRALDQDPRSSLTLAVDGFVHCNLLKDVEAAVQRYELALSENPNESLAWLLMGTAQAFRDEGEAAMRATQRALELSPLDPMLYFYESLSATAALSAQQWETAIARGRASLRHNRMHTSTLRVITIAQVQLERMDDARATAKELLRLEPGLTIAGYRERSPSTGYRTGELWAQSLADAGVPMQ